MLRDQLRPIRHRGIFYTPCAAVIVTGDRPHAPFHRSYRPVTTRTHRPAGRMRGITDVAKGARDRIKPARAFIGFITSGPSLAR